MLQIQHYYNFIESLAYFIAALIPIYFIINSGRNHNSHKKKILVNISIILVSFIIIQGIYHIIQIAGSKILAKTILEPASMVILLLFALIYLWHISIEKKIRNLKP